MMVASQLSRKRSRVIFDCRGATNGGPVECREGLSVGPAFAFERGAATIALDVHLKDRGVMNEAIDNGERHRLIGKDFPPLPERLVGGDQQGAPLVAGTDQFKQDAGLGLVLGD